MPEFRISETDARQAWIRSGKRGEPPKPPENM
jgi:hypothetical protein